MGARVCLALMAGAAALAQGSGGHSHAGRVSLEVEDNDHALAQMRTVLKAATTCSTDLDLAALAARMVVGRCEHTA